MSFILDALRKAEDKKRGRHAITVPSGPQVLNDELPEVPPAERNSAWVLMLLGAVLASGLWWFLQQPAAQPDAGPTATTANLPPQNTPAATRAPMKTTVASTARPATSASGAPRTTGARALDREARRGITSAPAAASAEPVGNAPPAVSGSPAPAVTPGTVRILQSDGTSAETDVSRSRQGAPVAQGGRVVEESLPDYRQSLTTGEVPIPELHLDIHVYSAEPAKRFVFINLDKYAEGEAIDKDTAVESIEPEGAVINHKGFRFVLRPD